VLPSSPLVLSIAIVSVLVLPTLHACPLPTLADIAHVLLHGAHPLLPGPLDVGTLVSAEPSSAATITPFAAGCCGDDLRAPSLPPVPPGTTSTAIADTCKDIPTRIFVLPDPMGELTACLERLRTTPAVDYAEDMPTQGAAPEKEGHAVGSAPGQ